MQGEGLVNSGLTVATYNIHYAIGTDRRFSPERIAAVILGLGADIVALQEVGWHYRGRKGVDQFDLYRRLTGYELEAGFTRDHAGARFGNALLSRWPLRHVENLDLTVRLRAPRGALLAEIETPGGALLVASLHLGLDRWERREQVERLLAALRARPLRPTLVLGDFNEWRPHPPYLEGLSRLLPEAALPPSFHTRRPVLAFDRIYASRHFALSRACAVRTPASRKASDHLPVAARLGMRG